MSVTRNAFSRLSIFANIIQMFDKKYQTFWSVFKEPFQSKRRLASIRYMYIVNQIILNMFFLHQMQFSYLKPYRIGKIRTCRNTLVPTQNYLIKVFLVRNVLYDIKRKCTVGWSCNLSKCVFGDEGSKDKVGVVLFIGLFIL